MAKYKVGDRVIVVDKSCTFAKIGDIGTIVSFGEAGFMEYGVQMDKKKDIYHDCYGKSKAHHGQWMVDRNIEPYHIAKQRDKSNNREFTVTIASKGDTTVATLIRYGDKLAQEAKVTRYYKDEYSEQAAIEAVVKKLFGEKWEEKPTTYYSGSVICIMDNRDKNMTLLPPFTKWKIYVIENGRMMNNYGNLVNDITSVKQLNKRFGKSFEFVEIKE